MNTEYTLEQQLDQVTEGFRQAEMARKYKEITEVQGPSQQLIDFINADGKLGEEIGLEGFESFTTGTQHEILLSKLNPDVMDSVAMEGFTEILKKYKSWLLTAGIGGPLLHALNYAGFVVPSGWGLLIAAGVTGIVLARADKLVPKMSEIKKHIPIVDATISKLKVLLKDLPSSDDSIGWSSFEKKIDKEITYIEDELDDVSTSYLMKKVKDSDWTPAGFISLAKEYESVSNEFIELKKSFASQLDKVDSSDPKVAKILNRHISKILKSLRFLDTTLKNIREELDKVAKAYDKK